MASSSSRREKILHLLKVRLIQLERLVYSGLTKFVELEGDYYPKLVKVFYANLKVEGSHILSRVKGVDIYIDEVVLKTIVGFHPGGKKCHQGISSINKVAIYKDCLRNSEQPRDHTLFRVFVLKTNERLCAFVIATILLPRNENLAQLNTKAFYLLHVLRAKIPTNWISKVSHHMIKITRQQVYHLPYVVFISKVMWYYGVNVSNEITLSCSKKNMTKKMSLHHMGLRRDEKGWPFKDEHLPKIEKVESIGIDMFKYQFKSKSEFEKFVVDKLKKQEDKLSKLQKSLSSIHRKLDYALRISAFGGTSEDEFGSEEDKTDEEFIEISDSV
ncbi:hypothetical protein LR48_Vigan280s001000 [Vigna angularis]|uniref:Putative plant transposon protein domain-containing protein n=1 Tax=Phaseolus angularis TaxID=3914 RepID=A0A0L9T7D9_PHAAN|nr:hypothetical protein LR48_Vigan280s001000 [Vigna angularis]